MNDEYLRSFLSSSARVATRNEIRELLKLIARPNIVSLAGGLPAVEAFPLTDLANLMPSLLEQHGTSALQYGPTEGDLGLRRELLQLAASDPGSAVSGLTTERILVTSASQQGLDLCGRIFIDSGDVVICGLPSYLGALGAFSACGARLSGVPVDEHGMRMDLLEQRLVDLRRRSIRPKFVYVVPDFQNPSGATLTLERRNELLAIAREFDLLVVEDSPYRALRYVGEALPGLGVLDRDGRVISLFSFSKILFPGLRLGWVVAAPEIISRMVVAKQPVDLCTNGLAQLVAREFLAAGLLPGQVARIRNLYARKRDVILESLDRHIDPAWGVRWSRPEGGMFLWMTLPVGLDAARLLHEALREKVAFVAGNAFHCDGSGSNTLRLNFSYPDTDRLQIATQRLAGCIGSMIQRCEIRQVAKVGDTAAPGALVGGDHALDQLPWNLALSEVAE